MKKIILISFLFLFIINLFGQDRVYRQYATQQVERRTLAENPHLLEQKKEIERHVHNYRSIGEMPKITIPVVFHVLYSSEKEFLDQRLLLTQLNQLNSDFTVEQENLNPNHPLEPQIFAHPAETLADFAKDKVNKIGVEFCLAKDELGLLPSINYHRSDSLEWSTKNNMKKTRFGGVNPWDTQKYLNIWVVSLEGNIAGYAQMPGSGLPETDGIVIDRDFISNVNSPEFPYKIGRTLSHLVGSFLGLHELWNDYNRCADDYVKDTPIHNAPNYGPTKQYKHISLCSKDYPVEMSMNIMDNSDDAFTYLFTKGQANRMYAMLATGGPRNSLTQSPSICSAIGNLNEIASNRETETNIPDNEPLVSIRPNPVRENLTILIDSGEKPAFITIYSSTGQVMREKVNEPIKGYKEIQLNTSNWSAGMYFVHVHIDGVNKSYPFLVVR